MRSPRNPLYAGLIDSTDRDDGLNSDIPAFNALLFYYRERLRAGASLPPSLESGLARSVPDATAPAENA